MSDQIELRPEDAELLNALRDAGSDLSLETHVLNYLNWSEAGQEPPSSLILAADEIQELGWEVRVFSPDEEVPNWLLIAERQMVPSSAAIAVMVEELDGIAVTHGAEYDGWEAAVATGD